MTENVVRDRQWWLRVIYSGKRHVEYNSTVLIRKYMSPYH